MARKDLLKSLMGGTETDQNRQADGASMAGADATARPRYSGGAIGAVGRSIADLKARSLAEIDARMIDPAGLEDRMGDDAAEFASLKSSLAEYGQQVPVLLRPNPNDPERYQVVYGRRRVAALRELGLPVKALVRVLNDRELVVAQGQENTARRDLSFIEKANFAAQMRDAGYDRKLIGDAISVDKTQLSRMLAVIDRLPADLIAAIGAAPRAGRDRWLQLAERLGGRDLTAAAVGADSDARFEAVLKAASGRKPPTAAPAPTGISAADGSPLATLTRTGGKTRITLDKKTAQGFEDWLVEALPEIHRDWKARSGG